jgi:hypothetical protein
MSPESSVDAILYALFILLLLVIIPPGVDLVAKGLER